MNSLLCLPKFIASHLRPALTINQSSNDSSEEHSPLLSQTHSPASAPSPSSPLPPPPPPKDVTAPTPTSSPYTWSVPEPSSILASFLTLIYPRLTFPVSPVDALPTLDVTCRVIRAAMGYQSSKALSIARDRLHAFIPAHPVEVYGMACFFKFTDLARLASEHAVRIHPDNWGKDARATMGRNGMKHLSELRDVRIAGMRGTLNSQVERDGHSETCVRRGMIEALWRTRADQVKEAVVGDAGGELLELLEIDLRGGHCGDCLVNLGATIQRCILAARELPKTI